MEIASTEVITSLATDGESKMQRLKHAQEKVVLVGLIAEKSVRTEDDKEKVEIRIEKVCRRAVKNGIDEKVETVKGQIGKVKNQKVETEDERIVQAGTENATETTKTF